MSLEKEEMKLRQMQTENVSESARGDNQRLELWKTLLPEIRKALKDVINGGKKKNTEQGICILCIEFISICKIYLYFYKFR